MYRHVVHGCRPNYLFLILGPNCGLFLTTFFGLYFSQYKCELLCIDGSCYVDRINCSLVAPVNRQRWNLYLSFLTNKLLLLHKQYDVYSESQRSRIISNLINFHSLYKVWTWDLQILTQLTYQCATCLPEAQIIFASSSIKLAIKPSTQNCISTLRSQDIIFGKQVWL